MYKLFLTFRYLTRKKIVIFPILVVWLCVMMLIIVTSIMGGFVDRVREANRDLYGDIIISSGSSTQGFSDYEAMSEAIKKALPGKVKEITPVVEAYALVYVPYAQQSVPALLVGVKPDERSRVTSFRESLFQQYQAPMEAVDDLASGLPATRGELMERARKRVTATADALQAADAAQQLAMDKAREEMKTGHGAGPAYERLLGLGGVVVVGGLFFLWGRLRRDGWKYVYGVVVTLVGIGVVTLAVLWPVLFPRQLGLSQDALHQADMSFNRAQRTASLAASLAEGTYVDRKQLVEALVPTVPTFAVPKNETDRDATLPKEGCIVGAQIGFFQRDTRGNFVHGYPAHFPRVSISVSPPSKSGRISMSGSNAVTQDFTIVDDSHSGVYDVDSLNVFAPFETVQLMAGMRPDPKLVAMTPDADFAPRCHQLLIRLTPESLNDILPIRYQISELVERLQAAQAMNVFPTELKVQTWDEKQARYLGAVQNEKTMLTFIMLLMSGVVLVVIFLIFYQIVRDKTRDIGIIKAVGGSEEGVAAIFLSYGLMIGIVGGALGILTGCAFVTHTNQIHEMIYQLTGIIIWDRSVYLFDRIPDVVHYWDVVVYFCVALVAGVIGALIPALLAASEDPVQAVRYE